MKASLVVLCLFLVLGAGCLREPSPYLVADENWGVLCNEYAPAHLEKTFREWEQPLQDAQALGWSNITVRGPYGDGFIGERWVVAAQCIVDEGGKAA